LNRANKEINKKIAGQESSSEKSDETQSNGNSVIGELGDVIEKTYKVGGMSLVFVTIGIVLILSPFTLIKVEAIVPYFTYFYILGAVSLLISLAVYFPKIFWRMRITSTSLEKYYQTIDKIISGFIGNKKDFSVKDFENLLIAIGNLTKLFIGKEVIGFFPPEEGRETEYVEQTAESTKLLTEGKIKIEGLPDIPLAKIIGPEAHRSEKYIRLNAR